MRTSIVLWSALSGAVIGVFVDALLVGVAVLAGAFIPAIGERVGHRWMAVAGAAVLAGIPLVLAVLGALEGRLKAN